MSAAVLYVIGQLGAGGAERQLLRLVEGIDRTRFSPVVATFTPGGALEADFRRAAPLIVLPKSPLREPKVLAGLVGAIRRTGALVVHAFLFPANWRGLLAARIAGAPVAIASVRNMGDWMGPVRRQVERSVAAGADAVVVNAAAIARFMVDNLGVRADRLRVIPNGIEAGDFRPAAPGEAERLGQALLPGDGPLVGCVMSLTSKKNPTLLVEAAGRVASARPGVRFVVAGEGPLREEVDAAIRRQGMERSFRLAGLRHDIPDFLRACDVLVLPSDREGLPNVILEAMATGLPVVATRVGGSADLVEDGVTGRLVPPRDPEAMAAAILEILADPSRGRGMGAEGLRRVATEYAVVTMVDRTTALYEELLALRGGTR